MAKELSMNGRKKLGTLQREFSEKFNFLTIIFLDQELRALDPGKSLAEVRTKKGPELSIVASLKVNTLEKRFLDDFGIRAEVSFYRGGRLIHSKENLDKSLNELNAWCAENGCDPAGDSAGVLRSVQEQLYELIRGRYPDAVIKKINTDNLVDIHLPSVNARRGTHLFFNTAKNEIKFGFFVREDDFIHAVLTAVPAAERFAQGVRLAGNPAFEAVEEAADAAAEFLKAITGAGPDESAQTEDQPGAEASGSDDRLPDLSGIKWVSGRSPLVSAVADKGDLAEVRRILETGQADVNVVDAAEGYTAVHYAAWDGHEDILALLFEHEAEVDPTGNDGRTPLHLAAANGHDGCVRLLLENGAEVDRRVRDANKYHGKKGGTALRDAVLNQFWDVYDVLTAHGADIAVLAEPCKDGTEFLSAVQDVAQQYPDVGVRFDAGRMENIRESLRASTTAKPATKGAAPDDYLMRWQVDTDRYEDAFLIGRIPSWADQLSAACPDLTAAEGAAVLQSVTDRKLIPILSYAPQPFFNHTKRVWWIIPLVVWKDQIMSWMMMDKNGFYAPHPGNEDICFIAPFDRVTSYELEEDERGLDRLTLYYDNGNFLTIDGFIPEGGASYLRIAHAIMDVRKPTIEASRGKASWKEGAGGEGFLEFEDASQLKDLDHWRNGEVSRPDPRFFA